MSLQKLLCNIHAPSGEEYRLTKFLLDYINIAKHWWKKKPRIYSGDGFQDNIVLVFGRPKTAVFAHIDSVGFMVKYNGELNSIGSPLAKTGYRLVGEDEKGEIDCLMHVDHDYDKSYIYKRKIDLGTSLTFKPQFVETEEYIQSPFLDNRVGVRNALQLAETMKNGILIFSTYEEHKGGSVEFLSKFIYEKFKVRQALISDVTWTSENILHKKGAVISIRDSMIPRKTYVNRIIDIAKKNNIDYQLEVESSGGSDGNSIQLSPYPIDWCFVGVAGEAIHSPKEIVYKKDIQTLFELYKILLDKL